jgi:glutamate--cysteine ligase
VPLAFARPCNLPDCSAQPDAAPNRFYSYGVVARLALAAAAIELERTAHLLPAPAAPAADDAAVAS